MVDVRNQDNSIKIEVITSKASNNLSVENDSTAYYSSLAKSWANKLDDTVDGAEYSSKYYALLSKDYSEISQEAKNNILENVGFQIVVEDLTGENSIKLCAENMNSIQNAASNAQIASEKAALSTTQAEIATQKAQEVYDIMEGSANVDLANITDEGKSVIQQYGGTWGAISGTIENQTDLQTVLDNKVNLNLDNCTKPYVTETYINGSSWYRLWSDGWCEQGGWALATQVTVVLMKPYKDTNYGVWITGTGELDGYVFLYSKSDESFIWKDKTAGASMGNRAPIQWRSAGYIS